MSKDNNSKPTIFSKTWGIILSISGAIAIISGIGVYFTDREKDRQELIQYKNDQKEVSFDDSRQKHDVIDLLDIEYHPFTVAKSTDTLKAQLKRVDTLLEATYNQKQRDARERHIQDSIDNANELVRQKNREERTKIQASILDELELIKLSIRKINKRLDTIK